MDKEPIEVKADSRAGKLRRIAPLCILVLAAALVPGQATAGHPRTYVTHDCQHVKIRPHRILFACADGGFYVNHLHWRSWHRRRAIGHGVFHQNDCRPDCAGGSFHKRHGRLVLRYRQWCPKIHKFVFKRAKIRYHRPLLGQRRETFHLSCPF